MLPVWLVSGRITNSQIFFLGATGVTAQMPPGFVPVRHYLASPSLLSLQCGGKLSKFKEFMNRHFFS
jgi:hypothetical protein